MEDLDFTKNEQKVAKAGDDTPRELIAEDLDFTKPSQSAIYDPATALAFFKLAGTSESAAQGETFFVEQQKTDSLFHKGAKMDLFDFALDQQIHLCAFMKQAIGLLLFNEERFALRDALAGSRELEKRQRGVRIVNRAL